MGCVRRGLGICAPLLLLISQGCNGTDPRVAMIRSQVAAHKELNAILAGVKDTTSMDEARKKLQARAAHFQQLADEASKLDRILSPEVVEQIGKEMPALDSVLNSNRDEMRRIQALPGGRDFLEDLEHLLP
jgi:hypothetical protein